VTTSSRKKGILPVRLGLQPDTKTALRELGMDESLADTMTDRQLDELIIENETTRIREYYKSQDPNGPDGSMKANEYKQEALRIIRND
tara:strand:- start:3009 stop:3272 length:264 start_codon:yes stop_codon:yes gene_type:complete